MTYRPVLAAALFAVAVAATQAQEKGGANYPLAQKFNRAFVAQHVQEVNVAPKWVGKTDVFWYAARTQTGTRYWIVDPAKKSKVPLFDHVVLAAALSEASKKPLDDATLQLEGPAVAADGKKLTFNYNGLAYEYDLGGAALKSTGKARPVEGPPGGPGGFGRRQFQERNREDDQQQQQQQQEQQQEQQGGTGTGAAAASYKAASPDKKWYAYVYKFNLYLCEEGKPEEQAAQLTKDGVEGYTFPGGFGGAGRFGGGTGTGTGTGTRGTTPPAGAADRKTRPNVTWSSDSKAFYVNRTDGRGIKDLFLVNSIATPRPTLVQYEYPMPGEDAVRKSELYYCDVTKKALTKVEPKWRDERYTDLRWGKAPGELRLIRRDRLQRNLEVCAFDVFTGKCNCLFGESFEAANLGFQPARYIDETDDIIWWSERSGWGHFYRYGRDGKFKNAITSGSWRAGRIVEVDPATETVYLTGNGREAGENPYHRHLYRVKLDGTGLTCLDPSYGDLREAPDELYKEFTTPVPGGFNQMSALSPSKKYVVTTSTRTDRPPFATLRDSSGKVHMLLEHTSLTSLKATGWKPAEVFTVKAADGVTDLYGNMWKPFDFDPAKKYPVVAHVYPGPQTEGVTHAFSAYSTNMQMAQLGFVVIQVGHRGGSPERSKAYHSYGYFNLRDYGLADKKAAIEALAARFPFLDITKVGIYGHSGGGFMSAAALLQKPYNEFFTAGVASAGNHDNNIYNSNWSEQYHGLREVAADAKTESGTATGTRTGAGAGTGQGTRRRPPAEDIEAELLDLLDVYNQIDPNDDKTALELEKRAAELRAKLAAMKQAEADEAKKAETKADAKTDAKAAETKAAPKMKWDIKVPTNAELAENLKGHLLLVHGEIDNNVHPANTMRLVDALIKANKRFDMLIIPGAAHGFGPAQAYFTQRMWDFFAEHLLGDRQTGADINTKDVKRR